MTKNQKMTKRVYITKSKAGHYTVTLRDGRAVLNKEGMISSKAAAQRLGAEWMASE